MNMAQRFFSQGSELLGASLIAAARELLSSHAHFRGRVDHFVFEARADVLIVEGSVPSFYLKQVLQTVLRDVHGVARIVNRVEVLCPSGLSSCSRQTRDRCGLEYAWLGKIPNCCPTCNGTPGKLVGDELKYVSACVN